MKYFFLFLTAGFVIATSSCDKKQIGLQVINNSLFFVIKTNNLRLPDSVLNNLKLYYFKNNVKTFVPDFVRATGEGYNLGVMTTRDIGNLSGDANIKAYYLEYQNSTKDTLSINYKHVNYDEAKNNSCYCYYPLLEVKYNGVSAQLDSSITQQKVYKFNKL